MAIIKCMVAHGRNLFDILCSQTATTPSYLFNTTIQDSIDYVDYVDYGHLLLRGIFAASE